jgi:hypothetical protein
MNTILIIIILGARVAARTTPSSIITTTTTTITTPIPSSTNFYLTGISTKFTLLVSTTSTTLPFSLQTLQSTLSTSSFTTTISSTTDFINTTKSLISLPTKDVTGNNSVMDASDKSTAQAIVIGIGSGLAAFIIMALLMALISSKNPRKRRRIAAKPIGSLESRLQLKQSAVTLKSSIGNSASQSAISSSEMRLKQQSPQSGFPSNFLPV